MTDQRFEARIAQVLGAYADEVIVPIDASRIAMSARPVHTGFLARLAATTRTARPSAELRLVLVAAALLAALVIGTWLIGGSQRTELGVTETQATAVPTEQVDALVAGDVIGTWVADVPSDLSFGGPSGPARMSLTLDSGGTATVATTAVPGEWFRAQFGSPDPGQLTFTARTAGGAVAQSGVQLDGCRLDDRGTYRASRSPDGLLLTLTAVDDPCPSRSAVVGRTWVRSLMGVSNGGLGVVDALDPMVTVTLPAGSYSGDGRVPGAVTIAQSFPEFQFLAFRDPQGFVDPCDVHAGRHAIPPGADAVVAYFRQLPGFTVDEVSERQVDGYRAVRLVVHANLDASCPSGGLAEWQPAADTTDYHWFLRPGDTDTLFVVERADATVMFEILPTPDGPGEQVIDSIRFLDRLPTSP